MRSSFFGTLLSRPRNIPSARGDGAMSAPGSPRSLSPTPSMNMLNRSLSRAPSNESLAPRHLSPACSGEHLPSQRSTDSLTGTLRRVSSWTSFVLGRPISPSPSSSSEGSSKMGSGEEEDGAGAGSDGGGARRSASSMGCSSTLRGSSSASSAAGSLAGSVSSSFSMGCTSTFRG